MLECNNPSYCIKIYDIFQAVSVPVIPKMEKERRKMEQAKQKEENIAIILSLDVFLITDGFFVV